MKKNRGFSIVELIVSFSLTMVIVVILFEIVVAMKDLYVNSVTKTELLNKQNLFTDYIYSDINKYELNSVSVCGDNCISFGFETGLSKNLEWSFYSGDNVSQALQSLSYGDYKVNLITNASFDDELIFTKGDYTLTGVEIDVDFDFNYLNIHLPIYHTMFEGQDFGINLLYVYETGEVTTDFYG